MELSSRELLLFLQFSKFSHYIYNILYKIIFIFYNYILLYYYLVLYYILLYKLQYSNEKTTPKINSEILTFIKVHVSTAWLELVMVCTSPRVPLPSTKYITNTFSQGH